MKVLCKNDITIIEPTEAIRNYCLNTLTLDNPTYLNAKKAGLYIGNIPPKMKLYVSINKGRELILPFGCFYDIVSLEPHADYQAFFKPFKSFNLIGNIKLYDYQQRALESLKSGRNGILEAPCGSGKTQIGLELIKEIGGRALWLTHTEKLLTQSLERCKTYFQGDFGTITGGQVNIGKEITFATIQTMSKLDPGMYRDMFDIVIVDECHHCVGSPTKVMQFYKVMTNLNCRYKYGLSATLSRADNMITCVYSIIGRKLYTIKQSDVGDKIIKAKHERVDIDIDYPMEEYLNSDGTIDFMKLITMLSNNQERDNIIVSHIVANKDRKQLVLCHRVEHVRRLSELVKSKGIKVACIYGAVSKKEREYDADVIIATYSLAKEGLDIPTLDVLHLATPQKNESTTEQSIGRIERNVEGKQTPVCYDYVDNDIQYCVNCFRKRRTIINRKNR